MTFDLDDVALGGAADAYQNLVSVAKHVLNEAARRRSAELPGLAEHLEDNTIVVVGRDTPKRKGENLLGSYECSSWQHESRPVDEIFLNINRHGGHSSSLAVDMVITLLHEAAHAWNSMNGIRDCTNRGRYHNKHFGRACVAIKLQVERHSVFGHATPDLQPAAYAEYADLIAMLDEALVIGDGSEPVEHPTAVASGTTATTSSVVVVPPLEDEGKYVFAICRCSANRGPVGFRMARGSWRPGTIWCSTCNSPFEP